MTRITKRVRRETDETFDGRPIIVALSSEGIILKEKGRRTEYLLPYRRAFMQAAQLHADAQRAAKPRRRSVSRSLLRGR